MRIPRLVDVDAEAEGIVFAQAQVVGAAFLDEGKRFVPVRVPGMRRHEVWRRLKRLSTDVIHRTTHRRDARTVCPEYRQ